MADSGYLDELARALARPDAETMIRQIDAYASYHAQGAGDWPDDDADDFLEVVTCHHEDPEKALAYVILGASRSDDAGFLGLLGCGPLEDVLRDPSPELLGRVVAEARKSARFRWLLSNPFKVAVTEQAWEAIAPFRITGPHEEPLSDTLPSRHLN
ncbi:hypothetical protein U1839_25660 [Sphingomonas sp. RT2P30]|uniref:DUF6869 domain-containing protein n=1 Tax=Parasphingomonas halimpatiens TaxID=3096162 RepID=UPI002FC62A28